MGTQSVSSGGEAADGDSATSDSGGSQSSQWNGGASGIGESKGKGGAPVVATGGRSASASGASSGVRGGASSSSPVGSSAVNLGGSGAAYGGSAALVPGAFQLVGAPLAFRPTSQGFSLNAVLAQGDPAALSARYRLHETELWSPPAKSTVRGKDVAEWEFRELLPGKRYNYEILAPNEAGDPAPGGTGSLTLFSGTVVTQRKTGDPFRFALITDSHIGPDLNFSNQGDSEVLKQIGAEVGGDSPDFLINLGDMLDFHIYGFNAPPPDPSGARQAYLNYRTLLGDTLGNAPHFEVIGNWESEEGNFPDDIVEVSRSQRLLYMPGPKPETYPESGSEHQDYYAFTWGDALFVVLNVMSYTKTAHLLSSNPGLPDDWTLGEAQYNWLEQTLANAKSKWRFLLIHHTVGGAAGDDSNSAYGRGGGQAAYVGEQAKVHELMQQYGVQIFFYGHDHVFADMTVDGIHYTLPGNAGAIWMFTAAETGYSQYWATYGWSRVTVNPESVNVQFLKMGGELLYEYTLQ